MIRSERNFWCRFLALAIVLAGFCHGLSASAKDRRFETIDLECAKLLGAEPEVIALDSSIQILKNEDVRKRVFAKVNSTKFKVMGDFSDPIFLSTIEQMQTELANVDDRLKKAGYSWLFRKTLSPYKALLTTALLLHRLNPSYHGTLSVGLKFTAFMSLVSFLEKGIGEDIWALTKPASWTEPAFNEAFSLILISFLNASFANHNVQAAIEFSASTGILFLPTLAPLSEAHFNRLWARRIFPIGLAARPVNFDGQIAVLRYPKHDFDHAIFMFNSNSADLDLFSGAGQFIKLNWTHRFIPHRDLVQFKTQTQSAEILDLPILNELERFRMDELVVPESGISRDMIEEAFFSIRHENYKLPGSSRFMAAAISNVQEFFKNEDSWNIEKNRWRIAQMWLYLRWARSIPELKAAIIPSEVEERKLREFGLTF